MASFMADQLSFLIGTSINVFSPEDATIKRALSKHLPSLSSIAKLNLLPIDQKVAFFKTILQY